jgi:osmotically-inducible protein OsmY
MKSLRHGSSDDSIRHMGRKREVHRRGKGAFLALGAALGAVVAFFSDPRSGRRRRALAGDRAAGVVRRTARRGARRLRIIGAHGVGWSRRVRHLREQPKDYDDATLAQKVQTEIFRAADSPKGAVNVNVANGVVQLRGEVREPALIDELVEKAREVQGVRDVESFLHLPKTRVPMDQ